MSTPEFATKFTGMGLVLLTLFRLKFQDTLVTGRKVMLAEPASPSSAGGQMALQHITLVQDGRATITVGWVNCATNECELRSWEYLEQVHKRRYPDQGFPVRRYEYIDFLEMLQPFMEDRGMTVEVKKPNKDEEVAAPTQLTKTHGEEEALWKSFVLMGIGVLLAFGATFALYWFFFRG